MRRTSSPHSIGAGGCSESVTKLAKIQETCGSVPSWQSVRKLANVGRNALSYNGCPAPDGKPWLLKYASALSSALGAGSLYTFQLIPAAWSSSGYVFQPPDAPSAP